MQTTWTLEHGRICATCADGRHIATWVAEPAFGYLVDMLNANADLSALLLAGWLGELSVPDWKQESERAKQATDEKFGECGAIR